MILVQPLFKNIAVMWVNCLAPLLIFRKRNASEPIFRINVITMNTFKSLTAGILWISKKPLLENKTANSVGVLMSKNPMSKLVVVILRNVCPINRF